jgi:ATP-binding cassette subfamily B multidrug efflux pump
MNLPLADRYIKRAKLPSNIMFHFFESIIAPTHDRRLEEPPSGLLAFYWHFIRQSRVPFLLLFGVGLTVAALDAAIPWFVGRIVRLVIQTPREAFFEAAKPFLAIGLLVVILRPMAVMGQGLVANQAIVANVTNLIRWQSHRHVVRQSWPFFQNDFAGRIAARVMDTGPALRESVVVSITAVWGILVYGLLALSMLAAADARLSLPIIVWFVVYLSLLRLFVPRLRDQSKRLSEAKSTIVGRIVDSYTNILTLKLFGKLEREDDYVRGSVDSHTSEFRRQLRLTTLFSTSLSVLNAVLLGATTGLALLLWRRGAVDVGVIAMTIPLTWQIASIANSVAVQVTGVFEHIGAVQEGMATIARPLALADQLDAPPLKVGCGEIRFDHVSFGYGRDRSLIEDLSLTIKAGEKIGLVGHSGAGKTTLVNLLLRFHEVEGGRILIDGQNIAETTQESLRGAISVVTQDTSLLHRSIGENIAYGRPLSTREEIINAAKRAQAHDFILDLEDWQGHLGYEAQVGERGVKLSGGQRQRIAIARVILKNAPILILDEATSALDSEVEAAIQESLSSLMEGKTVIAIAHRLSTIARMDRLLVMEQGRVVETGSHAQLLGRNGIYAQLWHRQSGGFINAEDAA